MTQLKGPRTSWLRKAAAVTGVSALLFMGSVIPSALADVADDPGVTPDPEIVAISEEIIESLENATPEAPVEPEPVAEPETEPASDSEPAEESESVAAIAAITAPEPESLDASDEPLESGLSAPMVANPSQPYCNPVDGSLRSFQQQHVDGHYTNGNAGKGYTEGDWVRQRAQLGDLAAGNNQFVIQFGHQDGITVGYDNVRFVEIRDNNGDPVSVTMDVTVDKTLVPPGTTNQGTATFNFTLPEGVAQPVWLYYEVHLANSLDYFKDDLQGASYYDGSSLHTGAVSLNCVGLGKSSLSIPVNDLEWGTLTVDKVTNPSGDPQLFDFSVSGGGSTGNFQLADQSTPWSSRLGVNEFVVTENDIPAGWDLTNITCTGTTAAYNLGAGTATFRMTDGAKVFCTFTNTEITYQDLTVSKDSNESYTATYDWDVTKSANDTTWVVAEDGSVVVTYTVAVTEEGVSYSQIETAGTIRVTNPNDISFALTGVTDATPGAQCTLDTAAPTSVPANSFVEVDYTCLFEDGSMLPADTTNTATVTWDAESYNGTSGTASGTAPVSFTASESNPVEVTTVDKTVTVTDTQYTFDPAWVIEYGSGNGTYTDEYTLTLDAGTVGECVVFDNTATVTGSQDGIWSDDESVSLCTVDFTKTAIGDVTAGFEWTVDKSATPESVNDPDGSHEFDYTVTVTADGPAYSDYTLSGVISITNPTQGEAITATLTDAVGVEGAVCTISGTDQGSVQVPANGIAQEYAYECTLPNQPAPAEVVNTALLVWGSTPNQQQATATATVAAGDWNVELTNETVQVFDNLEGAGDVLIGTITSDLAGSLTVVPVAGYTHAVDGDEVTFTYSRTHEVEPGTCESFKNVAETVPNDGGPIDQDTATVELCAPQDLVVDKSVNASYTVDYDWDLAKSADETLWTVGPDGEAEVTYTVEVTEDGVEYRAIRVDGTISIENPNEEAVDITSVVDSLPGATCVITDPVPGSVAGNTTVELEYSCTYPAGSELPDNESNTVTVTYDAPFGGDSTTASATRGVDWADAEATVLDAAVTVTDTNHVWDAAWVINVGDREDGTYSRTYTVTYEAGTPAECAPFHNTASITDDGKKVSDTVTVSVCTLDGSKTAFGGVTADFGWDLVKSGGPESAVADSGSHEFGYEVVVTPSAPDYSGYQIAGEITITNSEDSEAVTGDLSDFLGVEGAVCTIQGTDEGTVTIPANGLPTVFDYSCTLPNLPEPSTVVNTAVFVWGEGDAEQEVRASATVDAEDWEVTLTNEELAVYDDLAGEAEVLIGTVTVDLEGNVGVEVEEGFSAEVVDGSAVFSYEVTHVVEPGTCEAFLNTATGVPNGDGPEVEDSYEVELCAEVALEVNKTATATYDVTYPWSVTKDVDSAKVQLQAGGTSAEATYTVVATAGEPVYSGHELSGTIEVTNGNDWAKEVSLTDAFPGASCTVTGPDEVAANSTATFEYTCVVDEDYEIGEDEVNTVTIEWEALADGESVSATAEADVVWAVDSETDRVVEVVDVWRGEDAVLGTLAWVDGELVLDVADADLESTSSLDGQVATFVYTLELEVDGKPGCTPFTNVAQVVGDDGVVDEDEAQTEVCVDAPKLPPTGANVLNTAALGLGGAILGAGALILSDRRRKASQI